MKLSWPMCVRSQDPGQQRHMVRRWPGYSTMKRTPGLCRRSKAPQAAEAEGNLELPRADYSTSSAQGRQSEPLQPDQRPSDIVSSNKLSSDDCEAGDEALSGTLAEAFPMLEEQIGKHHSADDSRTSAAVPKPDVLHVLDVSIISATGLHAGGDLPAQLPRPHAYYLTYRWVHTLSQATTGPWPTAGNNVTVLPTAQLQRPMMLVKSATVI